MMRKKDLWKLAIIALCLVVLLSFQNIFVSAEENSINSNYISLFEEGMPFRKNNMFSFEHKKIDTDESNCPVAICREFGDLPVNNGTLNNQFAPPSSVLSPVVGSLRVTTNNQGVTGFWEFNRHMTGAHVPGGGWGNSNDTHAWDVNLYLQGNGNADVGREVFATANGTIVGYTGSGLPNTCNAVLIAHPNSQNPEWYSGYLHLANYNISIGQSVTSNTVIGTIGRTCADN